MTPDRHCTRRQSRWSSSRGASLLETLVALGLLAVTAATMSRFLVQQVRASSTNHLQTVAYALAAEALESARAERMEELASETSHHDEGSVRFDISTEVEDDTPADGLKTITARVSWHSPGGAHSIEVPVIYTEVRRF